MPFAAPTMSAVTLELVMSWWCSSADMQTGVHAQVNWRRTVLVLMLLLLLTTIRTMMTDVMAAPPHQNYAFPDTRQGNRPEPITLHARISVTNTAIIVSQYLCQKFITALLPLPA